MADIAKHTAGPWLIRKAANGDRGISAPGTGIFIEVFTEIRHSGEGALDECEANARLVAAAPDLLEVLKELIDVLRKEAPGTALNNHRFDAIGLKANNAISKAEGLS